MIGEDAPKLTVASPQDLLVISDVSDGGKIKLVPFQSLKNCIEVDSATCMCKDDSKQIQNLSNYATKKELQNMQKDLTETRRWIAELGLKLKELNKKC